MVTNFWGGGGSNRMVTFTGLRALSSAAPSGPLLPLLTFAICQVQWHGASRSALPPDLRGCSQWRAHFSSPTGDSLFSDDFFHSLSVSCLSRLCTNLAGMLPSLASNSFLRSPSARSLPGVDWTASHTLFKVSFPW